MLPDYRIRFDSAKIDFDNTVGNDGLSIDNYPAPSQSPRFDWMRSLVLGLISCQASHNQPTQKKPGTIWYSLVDDAYKCWNGSAWVDLATAIKLGVDEGGQPIMLAGVYATIKAMLSSTPTATFSGNCATNGAIDIPIPTALKAAAGAGSQPLVWVDGLLLDPRKCTYIGGSAPTSIQLVGGAHINAGQSFTVLMVAMNQTFFSVPTVTI